MDNKELRQIINTVGSQLVNKLPRLPDGIQDVEVVLPRNKKQIVRVVRLRRIGNKLRRTDRVD